MVLSAITATALCQIAATYNKPGTEFIKSLDTTLHYMIEYNNRIQSFREGLKSKHYEQLDDLPSFIDAFDGICTVRNDIVS